MDERLSSAGESTLMKSRDRLLRFDPQRHEDQLQAVIREIRSRSELDARSFSQVVRRYPKFGGGAFSKSEIIRGYRFFCRRDGVPEDPSFLAKVRMKPVRTQSGVAPVTVLTKPYPCPGRCIFCPNDVRMPKSYVSREPGAQRAAQHRFDPYAQTASRILALYNTGHEVDKVELIVLGGTWSFYPEGYQIWFIKRCFDAMNDFLPEHAALCLDPAWPPGPVDFAELGDQVDGRAMTRSYNRVVGDFLSQRGALDDERERSGWAHLEAVQVLNETACCRCVGLVVETRPDQLCEKEARRLRRLGCTKVQLGIQSLSDEVLRLNRRGHDVAATRSALHLLRQAGFKIHVHWMPNLYGSDPDSDRMDFRRLFDEPAFRPDELKVYPCSLLESAELVQRWEDGSWRPYSEVELLDLLVDCLLEVPVYCRVTRMIRDIPGDEILTGNTTTNFRELVEAELRRRGAVSQEIRSREIRLQAVDVDGLTLESVEYATSVGSEAFLQFVTPERRLVGFCRLSFPNRPVFLAEVASSAMIREVHVYGVVVGLGRAASGRPQHVGLGRRLIDKAAELATERGFQDLAVISSVGTREYYRALRFVDGELYQHRALAGNEQVSDPDIARRSFCVEQASSAGAS